MGESPTKRAFNSQHVPKTSVTNNDCLVDSIRHLLFTDNFTKPYSHEHCTLIYYASLYFMYYIMPLAVSTKLHME